MSNNNEDDNSSISSFTSLKRAFHQREDELKQQIKYRNMGLLLLGIVILALLYQNQSITKNTPCFGVSYTPKVLPSAISWQEQQQPIVDETGNPAATLHIFVVSNNYQWAIKSFNNIEATLDKTAATTTQKVSGIIDAALISKLSNADAIITVGMASAEGVDKNIDQQKYLAQQRSTFLASTLSFNEPINKLPIYTLDIGYFSSAKKTAYSLQRPVVILAIKKINNTFNVTDSTALQNVLYSTLKQDFDFANNLSINDYQYDSFLLEKFN